MMARTEDQGGLRPVNLTAAVLRVLLSVALAFAAQFALVRFAIMAKVLSDADLLWGPVHWVTTGRLTGFLLIVLGAVAGVLWLKPWQAVIAMSGKSLDEDSPDILGTAVMSLLLGFVALMGFAAAAGVVAGTLNPRAGPPANWLIWTNTAVTFALLVLIGGGAAWGLARLKPWTRREPMSPALRKTNTLFGLSGLIATASCLIVLFHTMRDGNPAGLFSNSPVALWVALLAIATWLLSWAIAWWWYVSADEHEQRASDVGLLLAGLLFAVATPVWWVAARAGLVPQPNAMILWFAVNVIWGAGWFWRRNR